MNINAPHDSSELLKRALAAIDQLQERLAKAEASQHEPIAIIGVGCRFPGGANDREGLWNLLVDGVDAVTEVPLDRWDVSKIFDPDPDATGKTYTKWGAFLDGIDQFDAPFFGITPREAVNLDPQQRLLLEVSWRALEDAGIPPSSIANTRTGVYVGITSHDYEMMLANNVGLNGDAYALSGTAHSIAGGRISYFLGAQGPNISVDTACSSSMVAVHLAVKGLRAGEADLALAGGVNVTLIADPSIVTSRARMMSPTGRCKAFDASADGYVRAEGCGIVTLKRLSDAQRDGDHILALIRGSAINQDGRSSGLTAPHGPSQEAVVRAALADGQLSPKDIAFIEAHGTGTALGDPIEVNALGNVFGERPADEPLLIGSIKANIGHTEGAAGIAGLVKAVETLRHRQLPKQLHFQSPNPMINWDSWPVRVPVETTPLSQRDGKPLRCGISSFGFSGTNAHLVLEEAPQPPLRNRQAHGADASTLLVMSARSSDALKDLAGSYLGLIDSDDASLFREVAAAAPVSRPHFPERAAIVAADAAEAKAALKSFIEDAGAPNIIKGRALSGAAREVVFLFTGQGSQYAGMGRGLYESEPAFRQALDECDRLARPHMDVSLIDLVLGQSGHLIDQTTYTQPALFALEYALAQTWRAWGVQPTAVMGHSVGEYTAACVAGMLPLEDAIRLIAARGRLMGSLPSGGAMAAVFASEAIVKAAIAATGGVLGIAAVNGPNNIVISGTAEAVDAAVAHLKQDGVEVQRLNVSHAFHSALMDPILNEFEQAVASARFSPPGITVMSNITGAPLGEEGMKPDYWRRHLREAVRFSDSIAHLQSDGYRLFLEVGPAPILSGMAQRCAGAADSAYVSSLRRGRDDRRSMLEAAGRLYIAGARLDWPAITGEAARHAPLPTYPFQRTRIWLEERSNEGSVSFDGTPTGHPLLGVRVSTPLEIYATAVGISIQPWAKDHRIFDHTPFPAAGFLELALAAAIQEQGPDVGLENVTIGEALLLSGDDTVPIQVVVTAGTSGKRMVQVHSAVAGDAGQPLEWRLHVTAYIGRAEKTSPPLSADRQGFKPVHVDDYYGRMEGIGAHYGPAFHGIRTMWRQGSTIVAEIALPPDLTVDGYLLHPALLDACFQPMGAGMEEEDATEPGKNTYLPVGIKRYSVLRPGATAATCRVTVAPYIDGDDSAEADIAIFDTEGGLVAEAIGLETRRITRAALERLLRTKGPKADWHFNVSWLPSPAIEDPSQVNGQNWLIFADAGGTGDALAERLRAAGASVELIVRPEVSDEPAIASAVTRVFPIDRPLHGAVLLWPLDARSDVAGLESIEAAHAEHISSALYGLRAIVDRAARVMVATRGTQSVMTTSTDLVQSPIWSFAGVVASEYPTSGLSRIDLDPSSGVEDADALLAEACASDREDRVAYRDGHRYLARLSLGHEAPAGEELPVQLEILERGSLGNLKLEPLERQAPGPGEVEIRVYATGLNFRDVLNALGMYQGDAGPLGNECAGVVTAIGPGVTRLAVGDDVVAMIDRSFATHVVAPETMTVRKPPFITYQEAATVPVTFLTADYALHALSNIKPGDRVLIHAVTGGVGMAATQIALRAGAIVFGTAGSTAKRELAKRLGVHHLSDSRSLDFVADFQRDTDGKGFDIVLNSLAGEFIPASLGLVAKGGSFVEIGKTDIWTPETVAQKYPGIRYHTLYLGEVAQADPELIRSMLEHIIADMDDGPLRPLPQTVFPLVEAERAFRYMGQGLHTGKVVVSQPRPATVRNDGGAYVITGGLTGLGLTTARWLAEQGARNLVLLGRRAPSADAEARIAQIEATGAKVRVAQVDVGDRAGLAALLSDVRLEGGPIRGVIHGAGVLDDGMLAEQTPQRFAHVMAPKVKGGWLLHELTAKDPLDFFVLFSSGAALLASPGQSNYAAANGFLDGLASYRHARGLPALSINWGSWAEVGMAAGVGDDHHRRWAAMGLEMITPETGMQMLASMLASGAGPQVAAVPIIRARLPAAAGPFYSGLIDVKAAAKSDTVAVPVNVLSDLRAADPAARGGLLDAVLADQVLKVLALPAGQKVDPHETLLNLGMDSLMAMELRNRIQAMADVRVAVADLLGGASLSDLGRTIMSQLSFDDARTDVATASAPDGSEEDPLEHWAKRDIHFSIDGDKLKVNAPKGALDDSVKAEISANRDALLVALRLRADRDTDRGGIPAIAADRAPELSFAQRRLWFLDQMDPGSVRYNIGGGVGLIGEFDAEILRSALEDVLARHEAFRTRISTVDGAPNVEILARSLVPIEMIDLSSIPQDRREAEAREATVSLLSTPLDLAAGVVARARIIRFAPDNHAFIMSLHHIISDGWSLSIMHRDLRLAYDARRAGGVLPGGPPKVRYVDFAAWEQDRAAANGFAEAQAFWRGALAGAPALIDLPCDRPRPPGGSIRGARTRGHFDEALIERLEETARAHGCTLFIALVAVWQTLLSRLSGQDDVVVGTTLSNRDNSALEEVVGFLVNNVPLRGDLSGSPSFADLLARTKLAVLGAFEHSALPFEAIVEAVNPERSVSHAPVFQTLMTLLNFPTDPTGPGGTVLVPIEVDVHAARFDLSLDLARLSIGPRAGQTIAAYEYAADLFDEATVLRWHEQFKLLLEAACANPDRPLAEVPLMQPAEASAIYKRPNDTGLDHDRSIATHALLDAAARRHPDQIAIVGPDGKLTYAELEARSNQLANLLVTYGVKPGSRVAVCLERSIDLPVALAAAWKAGAAYVPLDPAHPSQRLGYVLEDADVACAITTSALASLFDGVSIPLLQLDVDNKAISEASADLPSLQVAPDDLAYVIYTSGSTGRPKGVEIEHRNLVAFLAAMKQTPGLRAGETLLAVTTPSFDIAGLELWLPLSVGGRVVIASRQDTLDGKSLARLLDEHAVSMLQATPATWRLLLESGWEGKADLTALCGGEAMPLDLARSLAPRVAALWNMYGPTETTIWSMIHRVNGDEAAIPIGGPIANTRIYILDASGTPSPIGAPGELVIAGEGVARGYRNRPDLNAEKFVEVAPLGATEPAFRTGDLARRRSDGEIEFLGRGDGQVKIRGFRIELGEIEARLMALPSIASAVVTANEDRPGEKRLVAYVVTAPGTAFDEAEARAALRKTLPDYMMPSAFMQLGQLPLSPNGKVDRKALPAPSVSADAAPDPADTLMTPMQRNVAALWREVLHLDRVGLNQNFFDLGGHSLLLIKLQNSLKASTGQEIAIVELFQRTTVAAQAELLAGPTRANEALERARARARKAVRD